MAARTRPESSWQFADSQRELLPFWRMAHTHSRCMFGRTRAAENSMDSVKGWHGNFIFDFYNLSWFIVWAKKLPIRVPFATGHGATTSQYFVPLWLMAPWVICSISMHSNAVQREALFWTLLRFSKKLFFTKCFKDLQHLNTLAVRSIQTGVLILGGGVVKHHINNANLMRNGSDYTVYVNTGQVFLLHFCDF